MVANPSRQAGGFWRSQSLCQIPHPYCSAWAHALAASDSARPSLIQRRENGRNLAQNQQIGFITLVDQVFFNGFSKEIKLVCKAPIGPRRFGRLSSLGWPSTPLGVRGNRRPCGPTWPFWRLALLRCGCCLGRQDLLVHRRANAANRGKLAGLVLFYRPDRINTVVLPR
jgi:hypothetical protein